MLHSPEKTRECLTYSSAGNDIAALLPKYITIKRGFFICAGKNTHTPPIKRNKKEPPLTKPSPLLRNLPLVPPSKRLNLHNLPIILPNLPLSNSRNPNLRLLPNPPRLP
jgi:hypothetical protein